MQTAHQVVAVDVAIGHERAAVQAAAVEHADAVVITGDNEIDALDERIGGAPVAEVVPAGDGDGAGVGGGRQAGHGRLLAE